MTDKINQQPDNKDNLKFNIDLSAIESVDQVDQDEELQSLGLSVFDQNVFEKGLIKQFEQAFVNDDKQYLKDDSRCSVSEKEEGELDSQCQFKDDEITNSRKGNATDDLSDSSNSIHDPVNKIENYLRAQLKLHEIRKLQVASKKEGNNPVIPFNKKSLLPKKGTKVASEVPLIKDKIDDNLKKGKYVGPGKKRTKKEKLGTKKRKRTTGLEPASQPGEENYFYNNASGSEYIPSDESASSTEFKLKAKKKPKTSSLKKKKQRKPYLFYERPDTDDSDWDSDYDTNKRKGKKELDDGNLELYCRRICNYKKTHKAVGVERIDDDFVMPVDIWGSLYDYQKEAVKWFWNLNKQLSGGILGDEMGLGKTIQIIAFLSGLHTSKLQDQYSKYEGLGPTLIVCPTTVMHQWVREFHKWYPPVRVAILHESGTYSGKDRSKLIHNIHCDKFQGIIITSYSGLVQYQDTIIPKDWHYVILDEGHKIRNSKAKVTEVAKQLDTPHRIILSGSPLQNNLQELWCLFDFICPGKLGTVQVFTENLAVPIMQGGYANASQTQVITAHKCAMILKDTITPYLLRRMKEDVGRHINLPEKKEQVLFCRLTDEQRELYKMYLDSVSIEDMIRGRARLFVALVNLRKICNHPDLYSGGPARDFKISSEIGPPSENHFGYWEKAGKMIVIETLLKLWKKQGHRVLLFTQSKMMLTVMEDFAKRNNYKYLKLDGQTSISARQPLIDKFNKDVTYFLMLLTTKVGGLGVNLTGANRVVIYDPDWNPATDTQARERAWRIGQERDVTIYRLVTAGTIEEKIYHRQIFKQFLSNKILKDPRQRRFFKSNDLIELFTLSETIKHGTTETAAIFAGTGSEIKVPKKVSNKVRKSSANDKITFSENKIEQMKKLAQALSKKITEGRNLNNIESNVDPKARELSNKPLTDNSDSHQENIMTEDSIYSPDGTINPKSVLNLSKKGESENLGCQKEKCDQNENTVKHIETKSAGISSITEVSSNSGVKKKKRKKKHKEKFSKFEGEVVPHLVKKRNYKNQNDSKKESKYASQDDYVLHKLFSKGLETAMHHDTIMAGGPSDFAIVEAEAEKVAQDALKSLKESSQNQVKCLNLRLKRKDRKEGEELLSIIKKRNMMSEASYSEKLLLKDMIMWLQSQGGTSSTDQLIQEFRSKVGEGKSPIFKAILEKIAKFYRGPDRVGYWTIRDEFTTASTSTSSY